MPALSTVEFSPGQARTQLRGISSLSGTPTIGTYLDDIPMNVDSVQLGADVRFVRKSAAFEELQKRFNRISWAGAVESLTLDGKVALRWPRGLELPREAAFVDRVSNVIESGS